MRVIECEQGTDEWFQARAGIPTASSFKEIITSTGKKASAFDRYANTLAAERLIGGKVETFTSEWMKRGTELEPQARAFYEFERGIEVQEVGFCLLNDGTAGASPDALMADRGLEIKCPAPHTHVEYLAKGKCPANYYPQVQGCMWICEREQWDFMSFHPEMPQLLITVNRDDKFISALASLIAEITEKVSATVDSIRSKAA